MIKGRQTILHDDERLTNHFRDYGIMLPLVPSRAARIAGLFAGKTAFPAPIVNIKQALEMLEGEGAGAPVSPSLQPDQPEFCSAKLEAQAPLAPAAPSAGRCPASAVRESAHVQTTSIWTRAQPVTPRFHQTTPCLDQSILTRADIERVHQKAYVDALFDNAAALEKNLLETYELLDENGKPNRYEPDKAVKPMQKMFDTILLQLAGSYLACRLAMECDTKKFCFYLNGGNHHARYDYGAGFCLLNDVIIAARKMQAEKRAKLVWIIDVDAHKGCGSAELVAFIRKGANPHGFEDGAEIITLSAHMAQGWPLDDETLVAAKKRFDADFSKRAPFIAADVEIPVESGEEDRYTTLLAQGLQQCVALSGGRNADLAIVVDGADPYEHDGLESSNLLRLTLEQCVERDTCIYDFLQQRQIPSAWILAGGYGERAWEVPAAFLGLLEKKQTENRNKT